MRFRSSRSSPPFLNSRDQRRMLLMLFSLITVVVAIRMTAKPAFWWWMFPKENQAGMTDSASSDQPQSPPSATATDEAGLDPDEFLSRVNESGQPAGTEPPPLPEKRSDDVNESHGMVPGDAKNAEEWNNDPVLETGIVLAKGEVRLPTELFRSLVDRRVRIHREEAGAYFQILQHLGRIDSDLLRESGRSGVNYTVLMNEPDFARGLPVTLKGAVKRVVPFDPGPNPTGLDEWFDVWMFTPDSGSNPVHVRCLELPEKFPVAANLAQMVDVSVTGYFFRIEGYETQEGIHTAPLILARTIDWKPAKAVSSSRQEVVPYIAGFAVVLTLLTGLLILWFRLGDRRFALRRAVYRAETDEAHFEDIESESPEDFLARLDEN